MVARTYVPYIVVYSFRVLVQNAHLIKTFKTLSDVVDSRTFKTKMLQTFFSLSKSATATRRLISLYRELQVDNQLSASMLQSQLLKAK